MRDINKHGDNAFYKGKRNANKDNELTQEKRIFQAFKERPKTMFEVDRETLVPRANICRFVGKWKESNTIQVVRFGICPISKEGGVQFLTTNPDLFPPQKQYNLFESIKR